MNQEQEITHWYETEFWPAYPGDLTRNKHGKRDNKGSRSRGLQEALKLPLIHEAKERERIMGNLKAQIRYDRQDPDCTRWPMVSSYLHQHRYDDQIESTAELKERKTLKTCQTEGCNLEVHGERFDNCSRHVPVMDTPITRKLKAAKIKVMQERGLMPLPQESRSEYALRCRQSSLPLLKALASGKSGILPVTN